MPYDFIWEKEQNAVCHMTYHRKVRSVCRMTLSASRKVCDIWLYQRKSVDAFLSRGFIRNIEENSVCHIALSEKVSRIVCAIWHYQKR